MDAWVWRTDHWARPPRRSVFLHYLGALNSLYYVSLVINSQRVSKSAAQTHQMCIVVPEPWHRSHLGIRPGTACFPNAVNTSAQIWKQYWLFLRPEVNREFLIGVEEAELLQTDETAGIRLHLGQQSQWFFQIFEVLSKRISSEPPTHTHTHTHTRTSHTDPKQRSDASHALTWDARLNVRLVVTSVRRDAERVSFPPALFSAVLCFSQLWDINMSQ